MKKQKNRPGTTLPGQVPPSLALDWHGASCGHILFILLRLKISGALSMCSVKGGPEPREKESNEILGSKREDSSRGLMTVWPSG